MGDSLDLHIDTVPFRERVIWIDVTPPTSNQSIIYSWQGKYSRCVIGPTYAQGDRRDLGYLFTRLLDNKL